MLASYANPALIRLSHLILLNISFVIIYVILSPTICEANFIKPKVEDELPGETFLKFYLFNVTNPDEFESGEAKPALQQIGPYVFREKSQKLNITHSPDASTTSFSQIKFYTFEPSLSINAETGKAVSEDDVINIVNIPLLSFAKNLAEVPYVGPNMFRSLIKAQEKIIKRNVRVGDLFYYGYDASVYLKVFDVLVPGEPIPPQFEGGKFGLFKDRNGTDDGVFELGTGTSSIYPYGHIAQWKKLPSLNWWNSNDDCNNLNGSTTESTAFDRIDLQHYHLHVFLPDTCRSLKYTYYDEVVLDSNEIVGLKYKFDESMLTSAKELADNQCYCISPGENNKHCLRSGAMDISPCRNGAPLALTYPHFLDADKYYLEKVESGLTANRAEHESFLIVEPKTGTLLKDSKKFQLNIRMKPTPAFTYMKNLPDMLFPILWTEKVYTLDELSLQELGKELNELPSNEISWRTAKRKGIENSDDADAAGLSVTTSRSTSIIISSSYSLKLIFLWSLSISIIVKYW